MKKGAEDASNPVEAEGPAAGKGRPTPSRKQAQAANARPIVGSKDKTMQKEMRRQQNEARERARVGMMHGEERYLGPRDRGPQRRFVRDYVDARWSLGELLIPMMLVVLLMTFIPGIMQVISLFVIWAFVALAIIDAVTLGFTLRRKLVAKFGEDQVQPGFRWYAAMRAFQFRPLRMPKPQVRRRQFPQ
ncbi:putative membrane protein [Leucobacter exalbidus]|uniref:Membrane protein n=1 Tax=Leucobacter exalbidus TaxID=662960 RepID=A0A940T2R1_9MICO|nr:putative membrane protein [Leucobacter exalbidus]